MAQHTGFPGSEYVRYSAPEIPKKHLHWFVKMLAIFGVLLALGVAYGFWRISNVPTPKIDLPPENAGVPAQVAPAPAPGAPAQK